jgi:hypothetical protein
VIIRGRICKRRREKRRQKISVDAFIVMQRLQFELKKSEKRGCRRDESARQKPQIIDFTPLAFAV